MFYSNYPVKVYIQTGDGMLEYIDGYMEFL